MQLSFTLPIRWIGATTVFIGITWLLALSPAIQSLNTDIDQFAINQGRMHSRAERYVHEWGPQDPAQRVKELATEKGWRMSDSDTATVIELFDGAGLNGWGQVSLILEQHPSQFKRAIYYAIPGGSRVEIYWG